MTISRTVLFLIPHLGGGGAERVTANLVCGLPESRFRVHLGLVTGLASHATAGADEMPAHVTVHALGATRVRSAIWPLLRLVWQLKPDLIFSNMFHVNFLVLLLRPFFPRHVRCIIRQNGMTSSATGTGDFMRTLYRALYPRADTVVCQSEEMAQEMCRLIGSAKNLRILPNPVARRGVILRTDSSSCWQGPGPNLLAIGRLTHQKGFDMLLPAFARVLQQFPAAELAILGQGPEEAALKAICRDLEIESRVHFAGYVDRPQQWHVDASMFVLSSRHEGISNALLEAGVAGLPIVAVPALGGVKELLQGAPGTWLARDISTEDLADSLLDAMGSLDQRQRLSHAWADAFRIENALPQFENLIDEVLAGAHA